MIHASWHFELLGFNQYRGRMHQSYSSHEWSAHSSNFLSVTLFTFSYLGVVIAQWPVSTRVAVRSRNIDLRQQRNREAWIPPNSIYIPRVGAGQRSSKKFDSQTSVTHILPRNQFPWVDYCIWIRFTNDWDKSSSFSARTVHWPRCQSHRFWLGKRTKVLPIPGQSLAQPICLNHTG